MINPITKTINGRNYTITPWPAMEAIERFAWCLKAIAPLTGVIPKIVKNIGGTEEKQQEAWTEIMSDIIVSGRDLDPKLFREVVETLTIGIFSSESNSKIDPKIYFNDFQEDLFPLLITAFTVQISPFLKGNNQRLNSEKKAGLPSQKA